MPLAAVVTGLPNEKVGFDGDNFRSPLASGAMLKEKPFANAGADDVTALVAEAEVLAAVVADTHILAFRVRFRL